LLKKQLVKVNVNNKKVSLFVIFQLVANGLEYEKLRL